MTLPRLRLRSTGSCERTNGRCLTPHPELSGWGQNPPIEHNTDQGNTITNQQVITKRPDESRGSHAATTTFPFWRHDGHILFEVTDQVVLLDTGCGESLGGSPLHFLGEERRLAPNLGPITCDQLGTFIGTKIDVLMGVDLIGLNDLRLDQSAETLTWGRLGQKPENTISCDSFLGAPVVDFEVAGVKKKAVFDTGAVTTFVDAAAVHGQPNVGEREDFFPTHGHFTTQLFSLPVSLAGKEMAISCGQMPSYLEGMLALAGAQAIVGMDILKHCDFGISLQRRELHLYPLEAGVSPTKTTAQGEQQ